MTDSNNPVVSSLSRAKPSHRLLPWFVWSLGAAFFFCDYFARVSINVMAPDLMRAFSVSALGLGTLSSFFYYPYIAMQIPVGLMVDRLGVRRLLITMAFLTGTGCILFAYAQHLAMAQMGRLLIGFGAAFAFVSTLKLASIWFPKKQFGTLAGLTQGLGMFGAFVGGGPVALSVATIGWRYTMLVMAVIFFFLACLISWIVQDKPDNAIPEDKSTQATGFKGVMQSLKVVLSNPQSWYNGLYAGLLYAPTEAFAELWGSTYLAHAQGLTLLAAAYANGVIFLGWGFGGPWIGWLSDRWQSRRKVMFLSSTCGLFLMSTLLFTHHLGAAWIFLILFLYGLTNAAVATSYAVAAEINPPAVNGASMAFANMMSVLVGAMLQPLIGWFIDLQVGHGRAAGEFMSSDFSQAMLILPLCFILSFVLILFIKESFPKHANQ